MFSSFASLVFWGQPIARLWELLRAQLTVVQPVGLQSTTFSVSAFVYQSVLVCLSVCLPVLQCIPSAATFAVKLSGAQAGAVLLCMQTFTSCNLAVVSAALT